MLNNSHASKKASLLNINELKEALNSIDGNLYWFRKRGPRYISSKEIAQQRWLRRLIKKRIQKGRAKPELSMYGSTMVRDFWPFGGSLNFESSLKSGWEREYCDEYQGLWVNPQSFMLCTYTEWDVVYVNAPDELTYQSEYNRHISFINDL